MQKSTGSVELDIFEKQLLLHNDDPEYHLDISFNMITYNIIKKGGEKNL